MLKSLIWKNKSTKPVISSTSYKVFEKDLKLKILLSIMSKEPRIKIKLDVFMNSLTSDDINIKYRQCIIRDFMKKPKMEESLENLIASLDNMVKLHKILKPDLIVAKIMLRFQKLEAYYSVMTELENIFKEDLANSKEFNRIGIEIKEHNTALGIGNLKDDINTIKLITGKYKSLTLGVNLDHKFKIREAIITEINSYDFKKSNILDKVHEKDTNKKHKLSIAPEIDIKSKGQIMLFENTLYTEYEDLLGSDIKKIEAIINKYKPMITSEIIVYRDELCLYYGALRLRNFIIRNDQSYCFPEVSNENISFEGIYSINMMYEKNNEQSLTKFLIVPNNLYTENDENSILISGVNNGGKTVLLRSLATTQLLFQNGIIIPAINAKMKIYDSIYTHFPKDEDISNGTGRLGEEASRVGEILTGDLKNALVLLNEPYITTSPVEGLDILVLTIKKFLENNISVYLVTHYLNLLNKLDQENKITSYIMEIENGIRTYKAAKKNPLLKSFALDIAKEYKVDKEGIMDLILDRNNSTGEIK